VRVLGTLWTVGVPVLAILLGGAVRLRQAVSHRSLWLDEASVALNVMHSSLSKLEKPMSYAQSAPVLWLWTEHGLTKIAISEGWLRLPETIAGIGLLVLTWLLARQVLPRLLTPLPVIAVAASSQLIYFSDELKPYGSDAFCVVLLMVLALRAVPSRRPRLRVRDSLPLALAVPLTALFSDQALITGAGLLVYLFVLRARARDRSGCLQLLAAVAIDVAVLIPYDLVVLRPTSHVAILKTFWHRGFPPVPQTLGGTLSWLGHDFLSLARDPMAYSQGPAVVFLVLLACGVVALALRDPGRTGVLSVPVVMAVGAAIAGDLPLRARISLALVPPLVTLACGAPVLPAQIASRVRRRARDVGRPVAATWTAGRAGVSAFGVAVVAALMVISGPQLGFGYRVVGHPITREETGPLVAYLGRHLRPDQLVAVDAFVSGAWLYYSGRDHLTAQLHMNFPLGATCSEAAEYRDVRGVDPRFRPVWIVTGHLIPKEVPREYDLITERLSPLGGLGFAREPGARLYFFTPRRIARLPGSWDAPSALRCLHLLHGGPALPPGLRSG
jgi:hypothetical protein